MNSPLQSSVQELLRTIQEISRLLSHCTKVPADEQKATYLQFQALDLLTRDSLLPVGELASELHISKSSATQLVERLVQLELVTKIPDSKDKRSVRLELTDLGCKERSMLAKQLQSHCSMLFESLSAEDINQLLVIHKKVLEHLKQSTADVV